jgi:hypothetical protein
MTGIQMKVLFELYVTPTNKISFMDWLVKGFKHSDWTFLQDSGYITIDVGEGYVGGLRTMELTEKGKDFIKNYCDCCECIPCDCGFGS